MFQREWKGLDEHKKRVKETRERERNEIDGENAKEKVFESVRIWREREREGERKEKKGYRDREG